MEFRKELLTPCPILQPSLEDFADPIKYLSTPSIATLGKEYGILKVVPPHGWKPALSISPDFCFHTRLQRLSDLGITSRSRKFFISSLNKFLKMKQKRQLRSFFKVPSDELLGTDRSCKIFYYDLHSEIEQRGSISNLRPSDVESLNKQFGLKPGSSFLTDTYSEKVSAYANYLSKNNNFEFPDDETDEEFDNCLVCGTNEDPSQTLLCDGCDKPFHLKCLNPPLADIPSGEWFCEKCLVGTGEYGFEEQQEVTFTLQDFYELCRKFEKDFYEENNHNEPYDINQMEKKFWEFVEAEKSDMEVRYGADIHKMEPGHISGFPMKNSLGLYQDEVTSYYSNHDWNLTNLPYSKGSLLNFVSTSISGMTVPWLYIGSMFSTFCWHVEDHYTLSANYCHLGATKKWYAIPSSNADKFENLMKNSSPELFQRQPDLLHQLVTLMDPMKIVQNGIKCVYADQNANEFIVTYPRVYHAGFNSGFNFNEAVNFSMDLWIPFGKKAIDDYRKIKKENVFDFYELIENVIKESSINGVKGSKELSSLKIFEDFTRLQMEHLSHIDLSRFQVKNPMNRSVKAEQIGLPSPDLGQGLEESAEQDGTELSHYDIGEEEKLCDLCKTYLSFQYCIIKNTEHDFFLRKSSDNSIDERKCMSINQLLTPEVSPYTSQERERTLTYSGNAALNLSKVLEKDDRINFKVGKMNIEVPRNSGNDTTPKSLLNPVNETPNLSKKRQSPRLLQLQNSSKKKKSLAPSQLALVPPVLRKLNKQDLIKLCLSCLSEKCQDYKDNVPSGSILVFERSISEMLDFVKKNKIQCNASPTQHNVLNSNAS